MSDMDNNDPLSALFNDEPDNNADKQPNSIKGADTGIPSNILDKAENQISDGDSSSGDSPKSVSSTSESFASDKDSKASSGASSVESASSKTDVSDKVVSSEPNSSPSEESSASQAASSSASVNNGSDESSKQDSASVAPRASDKSGSSAAKSAQSSAGVHQSHVSSVAASSSSSSAVGNSSTARKAIERSESLSINEAAINKRSHELFGTGIDNSHDHGAEAISDFTNSTHSIHDYINNSLKAYKQKDDTKQDFRNRLNYLLQAQQYMVMGIRLLANDYNNSVETLSEQTDLLQNENNNMKETAPKAQLNMLLEWARTGMPHRIEQTYRQFSWIGNTPQFKTFMKENDLNKKYKLQPTSAMQTKIGSMKSAHDKSNTSGSAASKPSNNQGDN